VILYLPATAQNGVLHGETAGNSAHGPHGHDARSVPSDFQTGKTQ
jgi:hypothetical protein